MPRAAKPSTGRSLWERQRDAIRAAKAAPRPRFTFPPPAEPAPAPPAPAPGTYRIDQLRLGQCRFACTPHGARSHRFCGAATEIGPGNIHGSWCPEHLPHVLSSGGAGWKSRAEVAAKSEGEVA